MDLYLHCAIYLHGVVLNKAKYLCGVTLTFYRRALDRIRFQASASFRSYCIVSSGCKVQLLNDV
jgi:hypothetical protein